MQSFYLIKDVNFFRFFVSKEPYQEAWAQACLCRPSLWAGGGCATKIEPGLLDKTGGIRCHLLLNKRCQLLSPFLS
jgi:hypothetical protein